MSGLASRLEVCLSLVLFLGDIGGIGAVFSLREMDWDTICMDYPVHQYVFPRDACVYFLLRVSFLSDFVDSRQSWAAMMTAVVYAEKETKRRRLMRRQLQGLMVVWENVNSQRHRL